MTKAKIAVTISFCHTSSYRW